MHMQGEDDGSTIMETSYFLESRRSARPVGIYALHNFQQQLQYVGYSRNVVLAVQVHRYTRMRHHGWPCKDNHFGSEWHFQQQISDDQPGPFCKGLSVAAQHDGTATMRQSMCH